MPLQRRSFTAAGAAFLFLLFDFYLRSHLESVLKVCNPGIAFGIRIPAEFLLAVSLLLILLFLGLCLREKNSFFRAGYLLLFMGGGANFLDRVLFGCVRDYLFLPVFPAFPSFNLADIVLSLGAGCLALGFLRGSEPSSD